MTKGIALAGCAAMLALMSGCGPKVVPPPTQIGERMLPARARPVPF